VKCTSLKLLIIPSSPVYFSALSSNTLNPYSSFSATDRFSHPYETSELIILKSEPLSVWRQQNLSHIFLEGRVFDDVCWYGTIPIFRRVMQPPSSGGTRPKLQILTYQHTNSNGRTVPFKVGTFITNKIVPPFSSVLEAPFKFSFRNHQRLLRFILVR